MKKWSAVLLLMCLALSAHGASAATRSGMVSMDFDLSGQKAGEEVRLWIPYPVSDADQFITDIKVSGDYSESAVYTDRVNQTPILFVRWDKDARSRKMTLAFHAERLEVVRKDLPRAEACWDRSAFKPYLTGTSLGPIDGDVKKLALRITKGKKTVEAKVRAIYDWTCANMYRDPDTPGCGIGDVYALLEKLGGKCTDISSVFVALCRASGVPAREIFGLRLGRKAEEDITGYQHCWAEFYMPGYGWAPVDPADVRKAMLVENLKLEDPKTAEYKSYFWSGIDPYRIKIAVGRDVMLNPPQSGEPLNALAYPFAQVGNQTIDWLDPAAFKYKFTFKEK
ncbi:MAG: transglutaminase domain-containing protein [Syntrophobacteraceae bacterium]